MTDNAGEGEALGLPLGKNRRRLDPFGVPSFYTRHFDGKEREIKVLYADEPESRAFRYVCRVDDPETSFSASVFRNADDGHTVILYKGMDLPFRNEGSGSLGFIGDLRTIFRSWRSGMNPQAKQAENLYRSILMDPDTKSVEIVGYSIGSIHANVLGARYGAQGSVFADMGLSDKALEIIKAESRPPGCLVSTLPEITEQMRRGLVCLHIEADILPRLFRAGPVRGNLLDLDSGALHRTRLMIGNLASSLLGHTGSFHQACENFHQIRRGGLRNFFNDLAGLIHIPQVYARQARNRMHERKILSGGEPLSERRLD